MCLITLMFLCVSPPPLHSLKINGKIPSGEDEQQQKERLPGMPSSLHVNWGSEAVRNLLEATQLGRGRTRL